METDTPDCRMSGGEIPPDERSEQMELQRMIQAQPDVHALHAIAKQRDGRYLYLIETPFATSPRFVVGITDAENEAPELLCRTGALWSAQNLWSRWAERNRKEPR